ncbi:MATE family efflux transporter [Clostridium sp. AM29-11AC]|uniref:MATE family efflux transporter n=1 Tax=Clostridium sp. AM29-11AC TaxID=2293028 RepID=UPI000E4A8E07|nr:MATE family efflux transporter [Clostridium sp. AM29-11AC]RHT55480.1 MATE family efflux transporter [Clostridium sp. AM29-11AC]
MKENTSGSRSLNNGLNNSSDNRSHNNTLLTERLPRLFLLFVLPAVISMVISGTQSMIDGIFLGRFAGVNAMASVNIAGPYMQIITGCTMVICIGTFSYLGRTLGENTNPQKAKDIFRTAVVSLAACALILMAAGLFLSRPLALLLGANEVLLDETALYIRTVAVFIPAICFMMHFGFTARLLEKPHLYLIATLCCVSCNVIMDYLAVKVLGLGVVGAAAATGLSYLSGLLVVVRPFLSRKSIVNLFEGTFHWDILRSSAFNGSSEGITSISAALTMYLFNTAFMGFAGESGVAAFTVINYAGNFVVLIMFGVSDGISTLVSYNYGAKFLLRVKKTLRAALMINFCIGLLIFTVLHLFSRQMVGIFVSDNEFVTAMAVQGAALYSFCFLMNGFNILQSGYYTSMGDALASVIISASRGIVFISTGIFLLPQFLGINGVWLTPPFAELMTVLVCLIIGRVRSADREISEETAPRTSPA